MLIEYSSTYSIFYVLYSFWLHYSLTSFDDDHSVFGIPLVYLESLFIFVTLEIFTEAD